MSNSNNLGVNPRNSISGISCQICENSKCLIKKNIDSEVVTELSYSKRDISCKKGQQFVMEGAPVNGLFFILKGKVKIVLLLMSCVCSTVIDISLVLAS